MKLGYAFVIGVYFLFIGKAWGQKEVNAYELLDKILESIAEDEESEADYTSLLDEITNLIQNPLNVNVATDKDLQKLYLLNHNQIDQLLKYRESNGKIYSIYELRLIQGFSMELLRDISPMIRFNDNLMETSSKLSQQVLLRTDHAFEKELGYQSLHENSKYLGEPWKYYLKYEAQLEKHGLHFGMTGETDQGEAFFTGENSTGFDFYSAHIQYKSKGFVEQINLGDYQIRFGQGLSLWFGSGGKKSSLATKNARKSRGVRAYKSVDENRFLRGASAVLSFTKNIKLLAFASTKKVDATVKNDSSSLYVSSILNNGLHRSRNELDKKDALKEQVFGGCLNWDFKHVELGVSFVSYSFSPKIKIDEKAYSRFYFSGSQNYNLGFSFETQIRNIHLFGEIANSKSGAFAMLQGANIQIHPQLDFEAIYRKFPENYHAHFSNAFSEQSRNQNEQALYFGIHFRPFPKWSIKAYYDQFEFPWLRYSSTSPGNGHEYFVQAEYTRNEKLSVYFRYKQENKSKDEPSEYLNTPIEFEKSLYRIHLSATPATNWEIRNRIEFLHYKQSEQKELGFLIYQDAIYKFPRIPLLISFRYALFDTDSYNARIYAYESDILYAYSVPAYYNKGSRFYLKLNCKLSSRISCYARYAQTKYADAESIGSGMSLIKGNKKSDIKFLLKIKF